jgi:hypothetical protein
VIAREELNEHHVASPQERLSDEPGVLQAIADLPGLV